MVYSKGTKRYRKYSKKTNDVKMFQVLAQQGACPTTPLDSESGGKGEGTSNRIYPCCRIRRGETLDLELEILGEFYGIFAEEEWDYVDSGVDILGIATRFMLWASKRNLGIDLRQASRYFTRPCRECEESDVGKNQLASEPCRPEVGNADKEVSKESTKDKSKLTSEPCRPESGGMDGKVDKQSPSKVCPASCRYVHKLTKCQQFLDFPPAKRVSFVRKRKLCFLCLTGRHKAIDCGAQVCQECKEDHHTLLHMGGRRDYEKECKGQGEKGICLGGKTNLLQASIKPLMPLEQPQTALERPQMSLEQPQTALERPQMSLEQPQTALVRPQMSLEQPQMALVRPQTALEPWRTTEHPLLGLEEASTIRTNTVAFDSLSKNLLKIFIEQGLSIFSADKEGLPLMGPKMRGAPPPGGPAPSAQSSTSSWAPPPGGPAPSAQSSTSSWAPPPGGPPAAVLYTSDGKEQDSWMYM